MKKNILIALLLVGLLLNIVILVVVFKGDLDEGTRLHDESSTDSSTVQRPLEEAISYKDLVVVENLVMDQQITSPLTISGKARGPWFFEATFPIVLTNWDGLIIAEGYAEATEPWMTEEYVPFRAVLDFDKPPYGERGTLILHKANASGLPEYDDALEITINFE